MKIEELIKLPEVGYRVAEAHLNLVKEGPDIAAVPNPCCPIPDYQYLKAPSWEQAKYCKVCNRLLLVFPQDNFGGHTRQDPWQVYEEPTADNPHLSFEQHNHFIDFCGMVNPHGVKQWSYPNVYSLSGDYKRYVRMLKKTGKPDLIPLHQKANLHGDKRKAFYELNVISDYQDCLDILTGNVEIL